MNGASGFSVGFFIEWEMAMIKGDSACIDDSGASYDGLCGVLRHNAPPAPRSKPIPFASNVLRISFASSTAVRQ